LWWRSASDFQTIFPGQVLNIPARMFGGSVRGGMPYMVGEKGPELFVPGRYGSIVPNGGLTMSGSGDTNYTVNVTVNGRGDGDDIGRQVVRAIQEFERRNGNKWRA
jgi:phage-related minor tail protein